MNSELKPCPYCGKTANLDYYTSWVSCGLAHQYVKCDNCNAQGPDVLVPLTFSDPRRLVAKAWNKRTDGGDDE